MKNFGAFVALFCLLANTAYAQLMRDMSLSPEETLREPDIVHSNGEEYLSPDAYKPVLDNNPDYYSMQSAGKKFFTDEYCATSTKPLITSGKLRPMVECADSMKTKACENFQRLPNDSKEIVDNVAQCVYLSAQPGSGNDYEIQCREAHSQQLWLLKKYWDDPDTAYTILFLPDMLVDGGSLCQEKL